MSASYRIANGDLWGLLADVFGNAMPLVFFVGVVASLVLISIYVNSRSLVLTAVTAMLSGGVVVQYMPPEVRTAGYLLILAGVAAVGTSLYLGKEPRVNY